MEFCLPRFNDPVVGQQSLWEWQAARMRNYMTYLILHQRGPNLEPCHFGPVWHGKISKIVECRTSELIIYKRKYTKRGKMEQSCTCSNLGRHRTDDWTIIIKYLTRLVHGEFNFRCIWIGTYFKFLLLWQDQWDPRLKTWFIKSQSWIFEIHFWIIIVGQSSSHRYPFLRTNKVLHMGIKQLIFRMTAVSYHSHLSVKSLLW